MQTIVFESEIQGNVIEIPREYVGKLPSSVVITISGSTRAFTRKTVPVIQPRRGTIKKLSLPHLDTYGFIFKRDEANER
jgi:hypothetical protein